MKRKLLRATAMLMFSCMVASSIPTGMVQAEENVQSAGTVQEQEQAEGTEDSTAETTQNSDQNSTENSDESSLQSEENGMQNDQTGAGTADESAASEDNNEAEAQDDALEESETETADQAQEDSVIEKNANEINYVFVESPYLETPGTERIAVSYGDGTESVSEATLTVRDDAGEETVWELSASAGQVYLFAYDFSDESSSGIYEVMSLNITDSDGEKSVLLSDMEMEAYFGVNEEYDGIEELSPLVSEDEDEASSEESAAVGATVAEIDPDNVEGSVEEIVNALEEAEAQTESSSDLSASLEEGASVSGQTASKSVSGSLSSLTAALGAQIQTLAAANTKSGSGNIVVALDPGHDSTHTGASYGSLKEEVLTLKIAQYCKAELETYSGVTVYMTRTTAACPYPNNSSSGGDIGDRVTAAVEAGASIYVSLHLNSSSSSSVNGAEVIIPNSNWKPQVAQEGKELAQAILEELQAVGLNLRPTEIYSKNTTIGEKYPDGSLSDYFSVQIYAKEAGIPGIIVEHAFLTNSGDRTYLDSDADLKKLGVADATGIANYLGLSKWSSPVLTGATASANGTKISWNSVSGASGYAVYRKESNGSWSMIGTTTSTSYTDKTILKNGSTYYYTVRAYRGTLSAATSNKYDSEYWTSYDKTGVKSVYTDTPVLNSTVTSSASGMKVSWNSVSGVSGYAVYRKVSGGSWSMIGTSTSTSYTDTTVSAGKTYYYTVRAYRGSVSTAKANKYSAAYWSGYDSTGVQAAVLGTPSLSKVSASGTSRTISWSSVSGASGYAVYRKPSGGSWSMIGTTTSTQYTDKDSLTQGKTYYYTVRSYRGSVSTAKSNKYSAAYWSGYNSTGLKCVCLAVPSLSAPKTASSGITVSWGAVTGASGYAVYRKVSGGSWSMIGTTTSTSYTDKSGMSNGKSYYYTVRAYVGSVSTAKANKYSAAYWSGYDTSGVNGKFISKPSLKEVKASASGRTVSWSSVSGASGYAVYRKVSGGSWSMIGTTTSVSYTDKTTGLSGGKTYYYTVRAYIGSLDTAKSNKYNSVYWSHYDTTGVKAVYLSTPVLKSSKTVSSGVQISWNSVSGASGYAVYRKASGGSWGMIATTTGTSYTDKTSMSSGSTYYYTVRAYYGNVTTAKSNRYSAAYWSGYDSTGLSVNLISVPSLSGVTASASGRTVKWSSVSGASGYAVYRKVSGGSWGMIGTTSSTSYTDTSGMTNGKTYYYTVRAFKGDEANAIANKYSAEYWSYYDTTGVKSLYISTPSLEQTATASSGIKISWGSVSGASGYAVYRKVSGGSWGMIATTTSTSYTDTSGMTNGKSYYYTVRAYVGNVSTAKANKYSASYWSGYSSEGVPGKYISIPSLNTAKVVNSGIQVSWNAVSGASGYAVYRKVSGGSWGMISYTTELNYTDESISADGTTYYYTVRAYSGNQSDAASNKYSAAYWSHYDTSGVSGSAYAIEGSSSVTTDQMVRFYETYSPISYPSSELSEGGAADLETFAQIVYEEATAEGIRPEVVWCQAMLETGYLEFGGDVKISQFNFAGLGATGGGAQGASFSSVREGIRAQVQHLKAYASSSVTEDSLQYELVDPRFSYVNKGCAKYVEILGAQENPSGSGWATSKGYGTNIVELIKKLKAL